MKQQLFAVGLITLSFFSCSFAQDDDGTTDWKTIITTSHIDAEIQHNLIELRACVKDFAAYEKLHESISTHAGTIATLAHVAQLQNQHMDWQGNAAKLQEAATELSAARFGLPVDAEHVEKVALLIDDDSPPKANPVADVSDLEIQLPAIMKRLEWSLQRIQAIGKTVDDASIKTLQHELVMVATLGKVISEPGSDFSTEEVFRRHAKNLSNRANLATIALRKDGAKAFPMMWKRTMDSCAKCHASFR